MDTASIVNPPAHATAALTRPERRVAIWPALVLAVLVMGQALRTLPRLDDMLLTGDGGVYIVLADSLESGRGYRNINSPGDPYHVHFPPGFPLLLAGARALGIETIPAMKALVLIFGLAAIPATYYLLLPRVGATAAGLIAAWLALQPTYLSSAAKIGSDAPYLLLSIVALLATTASAQKRGWRDWEGMVAWTTAITAGLVRSVGVALVVVVPVYLAWHKTQPRWRARLGATALLALCYAAPLITWEGWKATHPSSTSLSYTTLLRLRDERDWDKGTITGVGDIVERYLRNTRRSVRSLGGTLLDIGTDRQRSLVGLAVMALIGAGMLTNIRRGHWVVEAYLAILAMGTLANTQQPLPRYLIPFLPFVLFYPTLLALEKGTGGRLLAHAALSLALVATIATHGTTNSDARSRSALSEYRATARWLDANTSADAVVLCRKPALMYLWSHRKSTWFPRSRDLALTDARVKQSGVTHVVADGFSDLTRRFLEPWIAREANHLTRVHIHGGTRVWRLTTTS